MSPTIETSVKAMRGVLRDPAFAGLTSLAWTLLVVSRGVVRTVPLRRITAHLGQPGYETPADALTPAQQRRAGRIRRAIAIAAAHTPTTSNCYPQALTATALLRLARLGCTVYYGARFDAEGGALDTHVWVRSGSILVTGAAGHRRYAPLGVYGYLPSTPQPRARARDARQQQRSLARSTCHVPCDARLTP
jgi:hypothetical protein